MTTVLSVRVKVASEKPKHTFSQMVALKGGKRDCRRQYPFLLTRTAHRSFSPA